MSLNGLSSDEVCVFSFYPKLYEKAVKQDLMINVTKKYSKDYSV